MLYTTYWPAGRVGRCYPQSTVSPIIGRGKRHARNRGKRRWNLKDSLRLRHYFRLMFLHEVAGKAETAPGSEGAGSPMPRWDHLWQHHHPHAPQLPALLLPIHPNTGLAAPQEGGAALAQAGDLARMTKETYKHSCRKGSEGNLPLGQRNKGWPSGTTLALH